jgi:hypothetical protein
MHQSTIIFFSVILLVTFSQAAFSNSDSGDSTLQDFKTDYCTMFPNGTLFNSILWKHCCYRHDLKYWAGGTEDEQKVADNELNKCVVKASNSFYAFIIYQGVRIGHYSPIKHKSKWGWGWIPARGFMENSKKDEKLVSRELKRLKL